MPEGGGLTPSPIRYGGGKPQLQTIVESLGAQLGTAFDTTTPTGSVYIRMMAYARAINAMWEQNQRLANQWDPQRVTDFIARWENILGLAPLVTDTANQRRARISVAKARAGYARQQDVTDALSALLGANFVGITTSSSSTANVWTPPTWPMGQHDTSPPTYGIDWYSTIAYLAVQVKQIANQTDAQFYATVGQILPLLDSILPAWVTFGWYRTDIHGSPGFYLDERNLDNEAFST